MSELGSVYSESGETPANPEHVIIGRSPWGDRLINLRQAALDLVTRSNADQVLNEASNPDALNKETGIEITAELKRFMDMARLEAIDEQGLAVDYKNLQTSPAYREYHQSCSPRLRYFDPGSLTSREEQLAFWINAYNAVTVKGILREFPTDSIRNHTSKFGGYNIWKDLLIFVGGQPYGLEQIEHDVLRKLGEPRIHSRDLPLDPILA